jgi:hypothetical protein
MAAYAGGSRGHTVGAVDTGAVRLVLDDGSVWQAYDGFRDVLAGWEPGHMITVKPNRDPLFPYLLVNVHRNESVEAQFIPA